MKAAKAARIVVISHRAPQRPQAVVPASSRLFSKSIRANSCASRRTAEDGTFSSPSDEVAAAMGQSFDGFAPVSKSASEMRYVLSVLYAANVLDAHGDWVEPEELLGGSREVGHAPPVSDAA